MSDGRQEPGKPAMFRAPGALASAMTDTGGGRCGNQDRFGCFPELGLYVVADGMGGYGRGDVAAGVAVDETRMFFVETAGRRARSRTSTMDPARSYEENRLLTAIQVANRRIFEKNRPKDWESIGTTIVAMSVTEAHVHIAHVGDSRAYLMRGDRIERLTRDHSLMGDYLRARPDLTEKDAALIIKDVVLRALGLRNDVRTELRTLERREGDVYLLCSDGLHAQLEDGEIAGIVRAHAALDDALAELLRTALRRDTRDNVTAVLVRITAR